MTARGAPGPWSVSAEEAELRDLTERLRSKTLVLVSWGERGSVGPGICGATVEVRMPGEHEFKVLTDAELASLRALELAGQIEICWPFYPRQLEGHAPISPAIEAAAAELLKHL